MGRVPSWCSRENKPEMVTSGVMFQLIEPVPVFRLSCCVNGSTPETPGTRVPATALLIVLAFSATPALPEVLTVHAPADVTVPQSVLNSLFCSAGFTFHRP